MDSTIYITNCFGLLISRDNGVNWTWDYSLNTINAKDNIRQYVTRSIYIKDSIIYLGTQGYGILISNDKGKTWTIYDKYNGLGSDNVRKVYANGEAIYAVTNNGISISLDNGKNWNNHTKGK